MDTTTEKLRIDHMLEPKTGLAAEVYKGEIFRIIDVDGQQVVDMVLFNLDNLREKLSTSYTRGRYRPGHGQKWKPRDHSKEGDVLLSGTANPMATFIEETPNPKGLHETHNRMCSRQLYSMYCEEPQDGCLEIISAAVAPYGLDANDLPDTMDIFMNCVHDCEEGGWKIGAPVTKPGDYVSFRAEMNLLVAISNCPGDVPELPPVNNYECTRVRFQVFPS